MGLCDVIAQNGDLIDDEAGYANIGMLGQRRRAPFHSSNLNISVLTRMPRDCTALRTMSDHFGGGSWE